MLKKKDDLEHSRRQRCWEAEGEGRCEDVKQGEEAEAGRIEAVGG